MSPAVAGAKLTVPATERYGFFFSEMLWPDLGLVIVTDVVLPEAPTASPAARSGTPRT